ncbi:MAG: ATP-dependent acyl-CoA ligase, partial [bacterium]|nr:ATP-dependent acyl-CoA ligase [bacterium]
DWLEVSIVEPNHLGRGEIVVRERAAGALFAGYFKNEEATRRALRAGALHTGDLGSMDRDGNLYFHGRINDSIRVKGEMVSAWEIESVAGSHPDVEECAAIGVDAEVGEQEIKLFVRFRAESLTQLEDLSGWLSPRLAPHQRPSHLAAIEEFPKTPSQRIIKSKLA